MKAFLARHPQLQTKLSRAIEAARVKDVNHEQILKFNEEFRKVIHEKNIKLGNIYNSDETDTGLSFKWLTSGCSIEICNGVNVVVDSEL